MAVGEINTINSVTPQVIRFKGAPQKEQVTTAPQPESSSGTGTKVFLGLTAIAASVIAGIALHNNSGLTKRAEEAEKALAELKGGKTAKNLTSEITEYGENVASNKVYIPKHEIGNEADLVHETPAVNPTAAETKAEVPVEKQESALVSQVDVPKQEPVVETPKVVENAVPPLSTTPAEAMETVSSVPIETIKHEPLVDAESIAKAQTADYETLTGESTAQAITSEKVKKFGSTEDIANALAAEYGQFVD